MEDNDIADVPHFCQGLLSEFNLQLDAAWLASCYVRRLAVRVCQEALQLPLSHPAAFEASI